MQIEDGKAVFFHYTLKNNENQVIDSSEGREPLAYIHGSNTIVRGLEAELSGKVAGDKFLVKVPPERGYGLKMDNQIQTVPMSYFEDIEKVEPGMKLQVQTKDAISMIAVTKVEGDQVTVDGNHPLAGVELNFDVEIVSVRDATEEEVEHGHIHGPGGVPH